MRPRLPPGKKFYFAGLGTEAIGGGSIPPVAPPRNPKSVVHPPLITDISALGTTQKEAMLKRLKEKKAPQ